MIRPEGNTLMVTERNYMRRTKRTANYCANCGITPPAPRVTPRPVTPRRRRETEIVTAIVLVGVGVGAVVGGLWAIQWACHAIMLAITAWCAVHWLLAPVIKIALIPVLILFVCMILLGLASSGGGKSVTINVRM